MGEPRKHHYVPKFFLAEFSDNGKSVLQIEKKTGRSYKCALADAATARDFHRLDHDDVADANEVEKRLAVVEGELAASYHRFLKDGKLYGRNFRRVLELQQLMRFRVPGFKDSIRLGLSELLRSQAVGAARRGLLPTPPDGLDPEELARSLEPEILNWKLLEYMFTFAGDEEILGILEDMTPTLYTAPEGAPFITADQPVAVFNPDAKPEDASGAGLVDRGTEITFPLSHNQLLNLSWREGLAERRPARPEEAAEFNRRMIVMAKRLVFAPSSMSDIDKTVLKHSKYEAGMQIDTLEVPDGAYHVSRFRPVYPEATYEGRSEGVRFEHTLLGRKKPVTKKRRRPRPKK